MKKKLLRFFLYCLTGISYPAFAQIAASISFTNPSCSGTCDGTAKVFVSGGLAPYYYAWNTNPINISDSISGLCQGAYSVIITDDNGSTGFAIATLITPSPIIGTATSTAATCGFSNGTAMVNASGGSGTYSYSWSTGDTTQAVSGLATGTYTVIVSTSAGCGDTLQVPVYCVTSTLDEIFPVSTLIYPNPAKDIIHIANIPLEIKGLSIKLFNSLGSEILHKEETIFNRFTSLDISGVANGFYLLQIISGENIFTKQITIE